MGQEILYCFKCGNQLHGDDFTRGRAHTFNHRQYCSKCLPTRFELPAAAPPAAPDVKRPVPAPPKDTPAPRSKALLLSLVAAGGAGVAVVVLVAGGFLSPAGKPVSAPSETIKIVKPVEQARKPGEPKSKYDLELQELDGRIKEGIQHERFGATIDFIEEQMKRHPEPEWKGQLEKRVKDVREAGFKLYADVKLIALTAQSKGETAKVAEIKARLSGWGMRALYASFEKELGATAPR